MAASLMTNSVILATSWAPLLSGLLHECYTAEDPTCNGGVAAFRAMLRYHQCNNKIENEDEHTPAVHLQLLDRNNAFVHMHPLGLSVNRLVLHDLMGLEVFASSPSLLLQNKVDYEVSSQDISNLQTQQMPLLLTNVAVPPSNSWYSFTEAVYFDKETGLAVLSISKSDDELNVPQIESAVGSLRYVRKINEDNGCIEASDDAYSDYLEYSILTEDVSSEQTDSEPNQESPQCWLPIIYHSDSDAVNFQTFNKGMLALPIKLRPAAIVDTIGHYEEEYGTPILNGTTWIASHGWNSRSFFAHKLNLSYGHPNGPKLESMQFVSAPLSLLPEDAKDDIYKREILTLRHAADEALKHNPVVGYSEFMPMVRDSTKYRPCKAGECPIGNLYTDAARWKAKADVAFITSSGVRGPGWPSGEVTVSDIWSALPFPNNLCTGYINGVHLFQLLNYSMSMATFEGMDTDNGGRLLQVSGMRVIYNTEIEGSRIIAIDILDRHRNIYMPLDRLQIYKFATDSYLCDAYKPFPSLLGSNALVVEGERPGKIEGVLFQELLADYLRNTTTAETPYRTHTRARLVNLTSATDVINLIETEDSCAPGMFWKSDIETCLSCPVNIDVTFSKQDIEFEVVSRTGHPQTETVFLKNYEQFDVAVVPKRLPKWLKFDSLDNRFAGADLPTPLGPGETLHLSMEVDPSGVEEGTAFVTIGFGVLDGGEYQSCVGQDATFDITVRVFPSEHKNQLGSIRAVGFSLFAVIAFTSISFAAFVFWARRQQVVRALQPIFLATICFGVLVMGSAIVPLSIDDEMTSQKGCNIKCMALPWLLSMGFSIAMSALFAKLWRINRLFNASNSFRRVRVNAKDVATPLVVLCALNFVVLLAWSFVDPLVWQRFEVNGESWNTYGICVSSSQSRVNAFLVVSAVLNLSALGLAIVQAWRARTISDEYSETKSIGLAIYSWLQVLLIGLPVLFLIDKDNTGARYFLLVALIFLVCMSMLLIIFIPLFVQIRRARMQRKIHQVNESNTISRPSSDAQAPSTRCSSNRGSASSVRISGLNIDLARIRVHPFVGRKRQNLDEQEPSDSNITGLQV